MSTLHFWVFSEQCGECVCARVCREWVVLHHMLFSCLTSTATEPNKDGIFFEKLKKTKKDSVKCYTEAAAVVTVVFCVFVLVNPRTWHRLTSVSDRHQHIISHHIASYHIMSCRDMSYVLSKLSKYNVCMCVYIHTYYDKGQDPLREIADVHKTKKNNTCTTFPQICLYECVH